MGVGICVVGVGLMIGLSYHSLHSELAYLVAGMLFFVAGYTIQGKRQG